VDAERTGVDRRSSAQPLAQGAIISDGGGEPAEAHSQRGNDVFDRPIGRVSARG
jgi:hypothetical protein